MEPSIEKLRNGIAVTRDLYDLLQVTLQQLEEERVCVADDLEGKGHHKATEAAMENAADNLVVAYSVMTQYVRNVADPAASPA